MTDADQTVDHINGKSLTRHALSAVSWSFLERWASRISSLIVFAILGRLLPIDAFGLVALASVLIEFLLLFADQGAPKAVVVERDPTPRFLNTAFWLSAVSGVVLFLLTLAIAPLVAAVFGQPELTTIIRVLGFSFIVYGISNVQQAVLQRELKFRAIAMRRVFSALIGGAAGVIAAFAGAGVWSLVLQTLVAYCIGAVVLWVCSPFRPGLSVGMTEARSLWKFGINVIGIDTLSWVSRNGDNLVVGAALGPRALGIYSVSFKLYSIVTELVTGVISSSSLPLFAKISHDMRKMTNGLLRATRFTTLMAAPAFALLGLGAESIIPMMYGDKWHQAVPVVQLFCLAGLLTSVTSMDRSVLLAAGRARLELIITAGGALLNVAAFLIGVQWGYQGVAAALVVRAYLYWPVRLWALHAVTSVSIKRYVGQWLLPIGAVVTLIGFGALTRRGLQNAPEIVVLVVSSGVGLIAYMGTLAAIDRRFRDKVIEYAPRVIRRDFRAESSPAT